MRFCLLLALLLLVLVPVTSHAQWIFNGKPISTATNTQTAPVAVSDGAGGAIITWQDARAFINDIYAQRIDATGAVKWTIDGVAICAALNAQVNPRIVSDGAGGAIIGWIDSRNGNQDIYAQRVNAAGAVQWTADGVVVCNATLTQSALSMTADGAGGAILTWGDTRNAISEDIYAQRLNSAGVAQWTVNGVLVCGAANNQDVPVIVTDGAAGAVIAWQDGRSSSVDIYAQRMNSTGVAQWTANGNAVCSAANTQANLAIASDGAGGAVMTWEDFRSGTSMDIYVQRFNSAAAPLLPADGAPVCTNGSDQYGPQIVWDNTTGYSIAWYDYRSGSGDIYAQRFSPAGNPQWTQDGQPVCTTINGQVVESMVSDGAGGIVMAWQDGRNVTSVDVFAQRMDATGLQVWQADGVPLTTASGAQIGPVVVADGTGGIVAAWVDGRSGNNDIYAQHVDGRYGYWGRPDPVLFAAKDVPADNGGKVRLEWYGSQRDQLNQQLISHYTIWRAIDQAAFTAASQAGVPLVKLKDVSRGYKGAAIRREQAQATDYFWELVGQQDATYRYAYSFNAPTSFDSTASSAATHKFQIVAHSFSQFINWPSNILTGRSVDNLAPPAPLFLTAQRIGNWVHLKWNGVHVPDLSKYTVYRKTSTGVTPIPANFLADDNDTLLTDQTAPPSALYYIVTATDIHQNQGAKSNEAAVLPATGVGNTPALTALTVLQNRPNPFTDETQLQVGLPARGDVRVEIYDVAGKRVRNVLVPAQQKGWNTLRISARDDRGAALPSGVYFFRVHAGAETVTKKMVIAH